MLKKLVCTFLLSCTLTPLMAKVGLEQVESLYQEAMKRAGGKKDFYTSGEIKEFNESFLPLIKKDQFPADSMMMIPGTKPKYIVNFLNKLEAQQEDDLEKIKCAHQSEKEEGEVTHLAPVPQAQVEDVVELQSDIISFVEESRTHSPIELPTQGQLASIWPNLKVELAPGDDSYIQNAIDESGNPIPYSNKIVDCEDCPSYVAAVSLSEKDMAYNQQCSGSLVEFAGKTYLYTNRHCIPEDMKEDFNEGRTPKNCSSRINITFPENKKRGLEREIAQCKKIVAISEIPLTNDGPPDWAVIEITPVKREAAKFQTRDTVRGEKMSLYPMYTDKKDQGLNEQEMRPDKAGNERWYAILTSKKVECEQYSAMNLVGSTNCDAEVTSGNSGSGTFVKGKFSGILSHIVPIGMSNDEYMAFVQSGKKLWSPAFLGTTSRDMLKDIYIKQKEDPSYRVYPMSELEKVFSELKTVSVNP